MRALDRKLMRDLRTSGGMLLAIASIIAAGVSCYVAMRSAFHNLGDAKSRYYSRCRMADFSIELKKVALSDLDLLESIPGVTEIRPRIQFLVTVDLERVSEPLNGMVLSLPEHRHAPILNDIVLKRGGYFTEHRDEEVIVNEAFAQEHGLHPGDVIHLLLNNRRQELHIIGTAISSEFVYLVSPGSLVPDPEHFGIFYLKRSYMEEVFDFKGACNQVLGLLAPEVRDRPHPILDRAERLLQSSGVFTTTPRENQISNRFLSDEIEQLGKFAVVMPIIFLSVAALVLNVLMGRLTEQQRTSIGTLKALGYHDVEVLGHFLKFGISVGLVGGITGCLLGYVMAGGMTTIYRRFFQLPVLENRVFPGVYVVGLVISIVCALLGVIRGTQTVLGLQPAEAMRPKPPAKGGAILLEHIGLLWNRLDMGWRMVFRNLFRNLRRSLVGVLAAAVAASLLVSGLVAREAVVALVDFQFHKVLRSDIDLSIREKRGREALLEVTQLPGVDHAEPLFNLACTFRNGHRWKRAAITGLSREATLYVPRDRDGRPIPIPTSGLVMGRALADQLELKPGDEVLIEPSEGRRTPKRARIAAISDSYLGLSAYADLSYLSLLADEEFAVSDLQLQADLRKPILDRLERELKQFPNLAAVNVRADVIENLMSTLVDTNAATTGVLVLFAGVIFFGTTLNASLVSLAERQREVATLLVMGYTPGAVGRLFLRESLLVNLTGTLLGLPLGYEMFQLLIYFYQTDLFRIPSASPLSASLWTIAISVVFNAIAHVFVQKSINRMDWLDRLKGYE